MNRRNFLKTASISAIGGLAAQQIARVQPALAASPEREYQGNDLSGWEAVVGDGLYTAPGQNPIDANDINTINYGDFSELWANVQSRGIMAHNITFNRIIDTTALNYIHVCDYEFRLPFVPETSNWNRNAQTIEGGFFIWDGPETQLDYGLAFQWILNPWMSNFGEVRCWVSDNGGQWVTSGYLQPQTEWHTVKLVLDYQYQATGLMLDGIPFVSSFSMTPKYGWGTEVAARLQAEIISVYPGPQSTAPQHVAEIRNWHWSWIPYAS